MCWKCRSTVDVKPVAFVESPKKRVFDLCPPCRKEWGAELREMPEW